MLENRNDLLEIKQAEILSIIERTSISLREEDISSKDILQSFFKSGGLVITPPQQEPPMMHMNLIIKGKHKKTLIFPVFSGNSVFYSDSCLVVV